MIILRDIFWPGSSRTQYKYYRIGVRGYCWINESAKVSGMNNSLVLSELIRVIETYYPPSLAARWDKVGLVTGSLSQSAMRILVCVDVTSQVCDYAVDHQVDVIIAHHPFLFKGIHSIDDTHVHGKILMTLIQHGIALYTAHTNADSAVGGVADVLAHKLGLDECMPLEKVDIRPAWDSWNIYIPLDHAERVQKILLSSDQNIEIGTRGNYTQCSWQTTGIGQFTPLDQSRPFCGEIGKLHQEPEVKLEFIAPTYNRQAIIERIYAQHPYEEPAFNFTPWMDSSPVKTGIGRYGYLSNPTSLNKFAQRIREILPPTQGGIRVSGDREMIVETVAVCPGAGDSLLDTVCALQADVYVTADLRHHPIDEYHKRGGKAVIDAGHWATEFPWCHSLCDRLITDVTGIAVQVYPFPTEPWAFMA